MSVPHPPSRVPLERWRRIWHRFAPGGFRRGLHYDTMAHRLYLVPPSRMALVISGVNLPLFTLVWIPFLCIHARQLNTQISSRSYPSYRKLRMCDHSRGNIPGTAGRKIRLPTMFSGLLAILGELISVYISSGRVTFNLNYGSIILVRFTVKTLLEWNFDLYAQFILPR